MRKSDLGPLLDYMYWVNHRLLGAASGLTQEQWGEPSSVTTRSLRATLVHEFDVEWAWRLNLQGRAADAAAELRPADFPEVETLRQHWDRDEVEMRTWFDSLAEDALERTVPSEMTRDSRPLWMYVFHVIAHAMQQQADAATLLTLAGHSPGELGYLEYVRSLPQVAS